MESDGPVHLVGRGDAGAVAQALPTATVRSWVPEITGGAVSAGGGVGVWTAAGCRPGGAGGR